MNPSDIAASRRRVGSGYYSAKGWLTPKLHYSVTPPFPNWPARSQRFQEKLVRNNSQCHRSDMGRNVEVKARIDKVESWLEKVKAISDFGPIHISQDDTFFVCPSGRLKLRVFSPTNGELIFYQRPDSAGPKESQYSIVATSEPDSLRDLLSLCLGQAGRVRKNRTLFLAGRTRIHLDQVEGLGDFIELEVVLNDGESTNAGMKVAADLLTRLGIPNESLVECAYVDLLKG